MKYIQEIKNRFILLIVTYASALTICYSYKETLLLMSSQFLPGNFCVYFIFTNVTEIFSVYLRIVGIFAAQVTTAHIVYHVYVFIGPALFNFERRYFEFLLRIASTTWVLSGWFSVCILIPLGWRFFLSFQKTSLISLYFEAKLSDYASLCITTYYLCFFYSQILPIFFFLASQSNTTIIHVKKCRKLCFFVCVCFATLLSPPDITSQMIISVLTICISELLFCFIALKNAINQQLLGQPIETN